MPQDLMHYVSVKPNNVTLFARPENGYAVNDRSRENLDDNNHYGRVSYNAKKRMRQAITKMIYITNLRHKNSKDIRTQKSKHQISFVTLTLPSKQKHTDKEIRAHVLNHFITEIRKEYNIVFFLWKAEKQKNGNLHYHLLFDMYIPWQDLRKRWNRIINKGTVKGCNVPFNYVDVYTKDMNKKFKNGFEYQKQWSNSYTKQKKSYVENIKLPPSKRWTDPNSTDIHSLKSVRSIQAYISKYMTKNIDELAQLDILETKFREQTLEIEELYDKVDIRNKGIQKMMTRLNNKKDKTQKEIDELLEKIKQKTIIEGRIWFVSRELSSITDATDLEYDYYDELKQLQKYLEEKTMHTGEETVIQKDFVSIWLVTVDELKKQGLMELYNLFNDNFEKQVKPYL